ncbi:hypothetical protein MANES_02G070900v8 [Manihot esculenta]|uniref:Uncharacterized protein n=1 Tax=Manihot esculenta TaxID=3983 RepID=A0A2C9WD60_MANES|nr:hypothetical protein MANES_02G070900v8 [Manihot esculenta]
MNNMSYFYLCMVVIQMVSMEAQVGSAVTCSPSEVTVCLPAVAMSKPPSAACCRKSREQRPCLCGYLKNPNLKQFISSLGDRRVARVCGVPYPTC